MSGCVDLKIGIVRAPGGVYTSKQLTIGTEKEETYIRRIMTLTSTSGIASRF